MHRLTAISLRYPKATAAVLLALTVFFAAGLPRVKTEFGYRVLIGDDHPSIQTLDRFIQQFGGGFPILIAWECGPKEPCSNVFDPRSLSMAESIRLSLSSINGVARIDSPAHSPLLVPDRNGFAVRRFFENGEIVADREDLARLAIEDPLWVGTLVSEDGLVGAIHLQASDTESRTDTHLVSAIRGVLQPFEQKGFDFYLTGDAVVTIVAGEELEKSTNTLIPVLVIVIGLIVYALAGSTKRTAATLATLGFAVLWTFGMLGWLGWPQDGILEILAPLILTVGVCDAIHLLSMIRPGTRSSPDFLASPRSLVLNAAAEVSSACTLTTLTTGAAFLSFATSDLETFVRFGCISAFGVLVCFLLTFSFLPLLCLLLRIDETTGSRISRHWDRILEATVSVSEKRATSILAISLLVLAACSIGWMQKLRVDNDWLESLGERSQAVQWIRFVEARLRDSEALEVEIALGRGSSLDEGDTLSVVDRIGEQLGSVDGLGPTTSITKYVKRLNRLMHNNSSEFEAIPADSRAGAEILELLAIGSSSILDPWMTPDRSRLRVSVDAPLESFSARRRILREVNTILESELRPGWEATLSGMLTINHDWVRDIQSMQLRSFPAAFGLVFVMVALFLQSVRLGLASMVPALLPVVVTLGAMGWMGMTLDVGRAMIAAVVIGIAVDDSIHLLSRYKSCRDRGDPPSLAIRGAVQHVGRALITTSLALSLGFLTLMLSAWQTISSFGFFVAIAIMGALFATLLVLPALIFVAASPRRGGPLALSKKNGLTLALLVPPLLAISVASFEGLDGPRQEAKCWILPTGRVALIPGPECPLRAHDEIHEIRWASGGSHPVESLREIREVLDRAPPLVQVSVLHGTRKTWLEVPVRTSSPTERWRRVGSAVLTVAFLLWLPLILIRTSNAAAVAPFAFFYSALGVISVAVIGAQESIWLNRAALFATVMGPAILVHLSMTFPREREIAKDSLRVIAIPYIACLVFFPAAWLAMERIPLLWPPVVYLLISLSLAAWMILLLSCVFAVRESTSPLERERAAVLLVGAVLLPVLGMALTSGIAEGALATVAVFIALSVALIPLPIGFAISRYNLFNLRQDVRFWISRLLYYLLAATVLSVAFGTTLAAFRGTPWPEDLPLLFVLSLGGVIALEPLRGRALGWLEGLLVPRAEQLRGIQAQYVQQMAELQVEQGIVELLGETVERALRPRGGAVYVAAEQGWRSAFEIGEGVPEGFALLDEMLPVEREAMWIHVASCIDEADAPRAILCELGIDVVATLRHGESVLGAVLLRAPRSNHPYTGLEHDFLSVAAAHAAMALRNAQTARSLVEAEREAATGRTALALTHEVSKDLGLIRDLARRIGANPGDPRRTSRDVAMIEDLSHELEGNLRTFVRGATRGDGSKSGSGTVVLAEAVERSIHAASRTHGAGCVREHVESRVGPIRVPEDLERILLNLLDNALLASGGDGSVRLRAGKEGSAVCVRITDSGCGMSDAEREEAFELGYTTRFGEGGFGVGLAVSRGMAESLNGSIELEANPNGGTIATVRVPMTG